MLERSKAKRIHRDFLSLVNNLKSTFGNQVLLREDALDFDKLKLDVTFRPDSGIYQDCEMEFQVNLKGYPDEVPSVLVKTNILHPNIQPGCFEEEEDVCLNILDEWSTYPDGYKSLELLVQGILFLFQEPNLEDGLVPYAMFETLDELAEAVNRTKYGTKAKTSKLAVEEWDHISFASVYKGPDPKPISRETTDDENEILEIRNLSLDRGNDASMKNIDGSQGYVLSQTAPESECVQESDG